MREIPLSDNKVRRPSIEPDDGYVSDLDTLPHKSWDEWEKAALARVRRLYPVVGYLFESNAVLAPNALLDELEYIITTG